MKRLYFSVIISIALYSGITSQSFTRTKFLQNCDRPQASYIMKVNNVRAKLLTGGDLFAEGAYIFPNNRQKSEVSAIYNAGIWAGGIDRDGNVKLSAVMYRSMGYDYVTGPLDAVGGTNNKACTVWDKIFTVNGLSIYTHIQNFKTARLQNKPMECDLIPDDVKFWPAQGNPYWKENFDFDLPDQPMANFYDYDLDGIYDPCKGDYPLQFDQDCNLQYHDGWVVIPAEINYFVLNDVGRPHSLSGPAFLGMEYHVNAYAYTTDNDLNNTTLFTYKTNYIGIIYLWDYCFGLWIDPDLGCHHDDYFGFDVARDMAFIYNEDETDGSQADFCDGTNTYGDEIPMLGIDFLKGFRIPKVYARDENGNILTDSLGNPVLLDPTLFTGEYDTLIYSQVKSFTYFGNGGFGAVYPMTGPERSKEESFYYYLTCRWTDGTPFTYGGNGYNIDVPAPYCIAYPDAPNDPDGWSMCTAPPGLGDRKFMMSTTPMLLSPGSSNLITFGVIGVENVKHPCPDLTPLRFADDNIQAFFDQCFSTLPVGPDSPVLEGTAEDKSIRIAIRNRPSSNNYNESYIEKIPAQDGEITYLFEGYKIYQLAHEDVQYSQLKNPELARLVYQTDIKNDIQDLYNWNLVSDKDPDASLPYKWTKSLKVSGSNEGIVHSITLIEDAFAKEDKQLLNGKTYYYMAVAYAAANGEDFDPLTGKGLQTPYLESTQNHRTYAYTPVLPDHKTGYVAQITRISGSGNPHVNLVLDSSMYDKILSGNPVTHLKYLPGYGPVIIRVNNPDKLVKHKYRIEVRGTFDQSRNICRYDTDATWKITDVTKGQVLRDNIPLNIPGEINFEQHGFSVLMHQFPEPGENYNFYNGGISATLEYKDSSKPKWFEGITIHSRSSLKDRNFAIVAPHDTDPKNRLCAIGNGYFFPMRSARFMPDKNFEFYVSPSAFTLQSVAVNQANNSIRTRDLNNVDIIFTSDKSKWSKCIVVETTSPFYTDAGLTTIGNARHFEVRRSPSIDQNGNPLNDNTFGSVISLGTQ
ncbi:MAG: hypothetical protein IPM26_12790 [Saprospiraceae bacterium]|nr:hypothetical protein [Saprospiraceae bacterium]